MDERGDALRLLGRDGAREEIGRQQQMFGLAGNGERRVVALAQEDGGETEMAAHGLGDEVLTFDSDEAGGGSPSAGERSAELFDTGILAAFNKTEAGADGPGEHRGDFTPMLCMGGGILCIESIFLPPGSTAQCGFARRNK